MTVPTGDIVDRYPAGLYEIATSDEITIGINDHVLDPAVDSCP